MKRKNSIGKQLVKALMPVVEHIGSPEYFAERRRDEEDFEREMWKELRKNKDKSTEEKTETK